MSDHLTVYDFELASKVPHELQKHLLAWLSKAAKGFQESLHKISLLTIPVEVAQVGAMTFAEIQSKWECPHGFLGFELSDGPVGLLLGKSDDLARLCLQVLGGQADEPDAEEGDQQAAVERSLSAVEQSLAEMLLARLVASIAENFVTHPLQYSVQPWSEQVGKSRQSAPQNKFVTADLRLEIPNGRCVIFIALDNTACRNLFQLKDDAQSSGVSIDQGRLTGLELDVVADLGGVEMNLKEFVSLRVGDIVVLDQSTSKALSVRINDHELMEAWPGVRQSQRLIKIANWKREVTHG